MKDNSNQPPKDPSREQKKKEDRVVLPFTLEEFKERLKKSRQISKQNEAKGLRYDHHHIEADVEREVQRRLESGEIFVNEQAIREELIAQKDEIIQGIVQKAKLRIQEEDRIQKQKLIEERLSSVTGIVSLNQIEEEVQAIIDQKNNAFNSKINSIASFLTQKKQENSSEYSDEPEDN